MKIIDFEKKGNAVRFYLGGDDLTEWYGDDWNDAPYEHNAGTVYDRFISGHLDMFFPFDDLVLEPCDGVCNGDWCKDDMVDRKVPCIIVVPKELADQSWHTDFAHWAAACGVKKFYFGDPLDGDEVVEDGSA